MKKLKLVGIIVCTLAVAVCMLAGCAEQKKADSSAQNNQSKPEASEPTTLIVGFDAEYPPYGYMAEDGSYTGLDLDLAAEVAKRNGWELVLSPINWDSKDMLLDSGEINCIWNGFTMEGREDDYTFSEPYMLNEQVIITKAGSGIESLDDLAGKTVVTQAGSAAEGILTDAEGKKDLADTFAALNPLDTYQMAFTELDAGTGVDAIACDSSVAAYYMAANPGVYVQLPESLNSEHYAVGFKKGNTETADLVTKTLKEMYADGTVAILVEKYADQGVTMENWVLLN